MNHPKVTFVYVFFAATVPNKKGKAKSDDLPQRVSSPWKVGAHVSSAGGVENSIVNAATIG